jgi:hypothetical protein
MQEVRDELQSPSIQPEYVIATEAEQLQPSA